MGSVLGKVTADGTYALSPASGDSGSQTACAVLLHDVAASETATANVLILARGPAIVADTALVYDASVNSEALKIAKQEQLAAMGIVTREAV